MHELVQAVGLLSPGATSIGIDSIKRTVSPGNASIKTASIWTLSPLDLFPG